MCVGVFMAVYTLEAPPDICIVEFFSPAPPRQNYIIRISNFPPKLTEFGPIFL